MGGLTRRELCQSGPAGRENGLLALLVTLAWVPATLRSDSQTRLSPSPQPALPGTQPQGAEPWPGLGPAALRGDLTAKTNKQINK